MSDGFRYVLITPARNAAATIERTIDAVRSQSITPARWIIVDDGSVDSTAEIVGRHAASVDWLRLHQRGPGPADFASKVRAFSSGVDELAGVEYDCIGNLDADVTMTADYFERVLDVLAGQPWLGVTGGHIIEVVDGRRTPQRISPNSVAGAVQLFRRDAFEQIGGLRAMRLGGEDSAAEILARMYGWEVATLFDQPVEHHGPILGGARGPVRAWFNRGRIYRSLGYDPLFQLATSAFRAVRQPPYLISGAAMLAGYTAAALSHLPFALADDEVAYLRDEQRRRLRTLFRRH